MHIDDIVDLDDVLPREREVYRPPVPVPPTLDQLTADVAVGQAEEARAMLSLDTSRLPRWFSRNLHYLLGPLLPLDKVIVAARPGCGKTSFMLSQARDMVLTQGQRIIYIGTEMPGWRLRVQVAAMECQLSSKLVLQNRWDELPADAKKRISERLDAFEKETAGRWFFAPEDVVDHNLLMDYIKLAGKNNATIFVDHLHEISWGGKVSDRTGSMTDGMQALKDTAKAEGVRLIMAAQLHRTNSHDVLADYMVPDQSSIKQCGTIEEVADSILLLHRALKPGATEVELALVRRGQKEISDVVEHGTAVLTVGKERLGGDARDKEVRLYVANGELFDSAEARRIVYGPLGL